MAISYSAWFLQADVQRRLDSVGATLRLTGTELADRFTEVIGAVTTEIGLRTLRQFIPGAPGEARYYDGNSTNRLAVDEMISLTSVYALASPTDTVGVQYPYAALVTQQQRPLTEIEIAQGYAWQAWPQIFPRGRRNIKVTGQFGYAATIPADLWSAGCGECAFRLVRECVFRPVGRVTMQRTGDAMVQYRPEDPKITGWHYDYKCSLVSYKRPFSYQMRRWRAEMI